MWRILAFAVSCWLVACGHAFAWRGHSWERWRELSGATTRPAVTSPQAGEQPLLELLRTAGPDSRRITVLPQWKVKQARIRRVLEAFLGRPAGLTKSAPEAVVLDEAVVSDHIRRRIAIRSEPDDWITAYLLVPQSAPSGPSPTIIVLHQTVPQGKDEPAGIKGDPQLAIARELVTRGYVCLVPDVIGFGERLPEGATRFPPRVHGTGSQPEGSGQSGGEGAARKSRLQAAPTDGSRPQGGPTGGSRRQAAPTMGSQLQGGPANGAPSRAAPAGPGATRPAITTQPAALEPYDNIAEFFQRHPEWSVMGKMNWDVSRCIDYLETLPRVDRRRIGCIGHSHGAYGTIFAAAFDPRIACAAASCGFNTLRTDPRPDRWCRLTPLLLAMGFYLPDGTQNAGECRAGAKDVPFDWHEICALIAPRPFLYWGTLNDSIFPNTDNLAWVFGQVGEVYALYGAKDRLAWKVAPGEHRFPDEAREWAYEWFDKELRR